MKFYSYFRLKYFVFLGLMFLTSACHAEAPKQAKRPNIIFIITDDQQIKEIGYKGGKALTPNIDKLARAGVRFNRAYVSSSVCSPSRYSCLTGQFASRSQVHEFTKESTSEGVTRVLWNIGFTEEQDTLPKTLQSNGYKTGFVGKWHVGGVAGWKPIEKGEDPASEKVRASLKKMQGLFSKGLKKHGFDFAKNIYIGNPNDDLALVNLGLNVHNMEWLTEAGLEFIEENKDNPFYLYFSTTLTHVPDGYESLAGDARRTPVGLLDKPIEGVQKSRESVMKRCRDAGLSKELWAATWLDDGIGALIDKLEELKIADNTLIVYFVDHGMSSASKGTCYEGGLISPAFAFWKGKTPTVSTDAIIQNTDFVPTFFELAGVIPPKTMKIDGQSFASLIKGDVSFKGHESVYSEIGLTRAVTTKDWKYIAFKVPASLQRTRAERFTEHKKLFAEMQTTHPWSGFKHWKLDPEARYYQMGMAAGGAGFERYQIENDPAWKQHYFDEDQLYHLKNDPSESKNLASDPVYKEKLREMKTLLTSYLKDLPGTYPELKPNQ